MRGRGETARMGRSRRMGRTTAVPLSSSAGSASSKSCEWAWRSSSRDLVCSLAPAATAPHMLATRCVESVPLAGALDDAFEANMTSLSKESRRFIGGSL